MIRLVSVVALALVVAAAARAAAVTPEERCEAYQLAASGQRISAKLHCRAWAKLTGTEVDASCLDKAEKRFLLQLQDGGSGCATPDEVVSLGAAADAQSNAVVADLQPGSPTIPSLSGKWRTRTAVGVKPDGGFAIDCSYYAPGACPPANMFATIDCDTTLDQQGTSLSFASLCSTTPDSSVKFESFTQSATGSIDVVTGEWLLAGTVRIYGLDPIDYQGEGVFSADGRTQTGFTTAGWSGSGGSLWLATTTGQRVD
jgi:hypothetical protein